jgi:hypothetical protein
VHMYTVLASIACTDTYSALYLAHTLYCV